MGVFMMTAIQLDDKWESDGKSEFDITELNADKGIEFVERLRVKIEEVDLDQYLRKSMGGYTKQSVIEYLGQLRKQQQITAATFSRNMQILHDEKEALKKGNEMLQSRLGTVESNYENLSESIHLFEYENKGFSVKDVVGLKNNNSMLEGEVKKKQHEIESLHVQLDRLNAANQDLKTKLEQTDQEIAAQKQLVMAEKMETKKQRNIASDTYSKLEAQQDQNNYLTELISSGELAQTKAKVNDLLEQLAALSDVNAKLMADSDMKDQAIETLKNQIELVNQRIYVISVTLEEMNDQNDKLFAVNQALTNQLEEEYKKAIALVRERSNIMMEKLSAVNKLNDANTRISIMEQLLDKDKKSDDLRTIYRHINDLEYEKDVANQQISEDEQQLSKDNQQTLEDNQQTLEDNQQTLEDNQQLSKDNKQTLKDKQQLFKDKLQTMDDLRRNIKKRTHYHEAFQAE
jgi:DNA repair exonuclease SbcCD ATPase subunit